MSNSIIKELDEIGKLLAKADSLSSLRNKLASVQADLCITDGQHENKEYDIVVAGIKVDESLVSRRISESMPQAKIAHIVDGMLGINISRRKFNKEQ